MTSTINPPPSRQQAEFTRSDAQVFVGVALLILGVIAVAASVLATFAAVIVFGVMLVAAAVSEFVHAFRVRGASDNWLRIISGVVYLIAGILVLSNPVAGALTLTLAIAIFLFIEGIVRIVSGIRHKPGNRNWGWFIASGVIDLVLGAIVALGWPGTGLWVLGLFVGIDMIVNGISTLAITPRLERSRDGEPLPPAGVTR